MKETNKGHKNGFCLIQDKKKKIKKDGILVIDIRICLNNTNKK